MKIYKDKFREISVYYMSICDDMKHATGIISATSIGIVLLYKYITLQIQWDTLALMYNRRHSKKFNTYDLRVV